MRTNSLAARGAASVLAVFMGASTLIAQTRTPDVISSPARPAGTTGTVPNLGYKLLPEEEALAHSENGKISILTLIGNNVSISSEQEKALKEKIAEIFSHDARVETYFKRVDSPGFGFYAYVNGHDYISLITKDKLIELNNLATESASIRERANLSGFNAQRLER